MEDLVPRARGLRQQLHEWRENLPDSLQLASDKRPASPDEDPDDTVESHTPLYLVYYTTHILLFRALLRPIIGKSNNEVSTNNREDAEGTTAAVLYASRNLIRTVIKFLCGFDARQQSAFWPAYTRHCLSYPGLFCYMLSLQRCEPQMASNDRSLLATWRKILRTRVQSWPLLRFAIVKIDAIYYRGVRQ